MRYSVATFDFHFAESWQADVFAQTLFDMGFDTLDDNKAYIPTEMWEANKSGIEDLLSHTEGVTLLSFDACPDENWNAVWEAEHPVQELPLGVRIIPHCAFGAGHHETTSMMVDALLHHMASVPDTPFRVLDHGTGTGVLAIFAKRLGADYVLALDIDDKSVANAKENAALNEVDIDVRLSNDQLSITNDQSPITNYQYNLILANIHRNVLMAFMPQYAGSLVSGGELWLSGFYETDCTALIQQAEQNGLRHIDTQSNGEWRMLRFKKG